MPGSQAIGALACRPAHSFAPTGLQWCFSPNLLPLHLPVGLPFSFDYRTALQVCLMSCQATVYFSATWTWCFCTPGHRCLNGHTHADESMFQHWINKKSCFLCTFILDLLTLNPVWSFESVWQGSSGGPDIRRAGPANHGQRPSVCPLFRYPWNFRVLQAGLSFSWDQTTFSKWLDKPKAAFSRFWKELWWHLVPPYKGFWH